MRFDSSSFDWAKAARSARAWAEAQQVELRDAICLVPFVQLLAPARRAWAEGGSWMPRIETTQTLTASLAPPRARPPGQISFDVPTDRLLAARRLLAHGWAKAWRGRDPGGFEQAVASVVQVAQALARAAAEVAPGERAAYFEQGRAAVASADGPGLTESQLARIAFDWATEAAPPATDRLFALHPAAWIAVRVGGADRLVDGLLHAAGCPSLVIDADVPVEQPFEALAEQAEVEVIVCDDVEDEAQRSAARVLHHLQHGQAPVALIAQDRSLVRRVRALLERHRVPLLDETGWRLSTTRAAARVMTLMRSLSRQGSTDDLLDWLKAGADDGPSLHARAFATGLLERRLRRDGRARLQAIDPASLTGPSAALWAEIDSLRLSFAAERSRTLADWCGALQQVLADSGDATNLGADAAGEQVLAALHLREDGTDDAAWLDLARTTRFDFAEFLAWADTALEQSTFIPPAPANVMVVITPLARAMLRPFAAAVLPGADDKRLGGGGFALPLLADAQAVALGLDGQGARRNAELQAFAQLLRLPRVTVLRRRRDDSEPLAASPLLERLLLAMRQAGRTPPAAGDDRRPMFVTAQPTPRPMPSAPAFLPQRVSASAVEALRACPYRFFALNMLSLREQDELDDTLEKRDYGTWLHAVLHRFHRDRPHPREPLADRSALKEAAAAEQAAMGLDAAEFLPYAAAFERLLPHYVAWLRRRDGEGARWRDGEREFTATAAPLAGIELVGRIDRLDDLRHQAVELIDYKTGDVEALKSGMKQPAEDTQLAFYAVLVSQQPAPLGQSLAASYLGLDGSGGVVRVEHPHVEATARVMIDGLAVDFERLRQGAPMPALGEGRVCDHCAARGLCRRDDWATLDAPAP